MAERTDCCSYEPSLEDLLDDEVMEPVLRSAGFDSQGLRDMMVETAKRIDDSRIEVRRIDDRDQRRRDR
jgi:hypothetical protein